MTTPATRSERLSVTRYRRVGVLVLAMLFVVALVVVVAQFDHGRYVYLQPLRGAVMLSVAVFVMPLLVGAAVSLGAPAVDRSSWAAKGGALLAFLLAVALWCGYPVTHLFFYEEMDHDVAVVAVAPDRRLEVIVATRYGDSGNYVILRARSRDGVFSRNAIHPLASICYDADQIEVSFVGPAEVKVRAHDGFEGTATVNPRTLETANPIDTCADHD
ncbi:hypothetical protein AB0M46_21080 [Dactylosporangium sp. NPDC051485]|uniref:hypothetical protein n=1 Tax=Dactylosporangium sp. NPDC051485 TaxID=3154846 RepID=UPI00342A012F